MADILADVQKVFKDTRAEFTGEALKLNQEGYCLNTDDPERDTEQVVRRPDGTYEFSPFGEPESSGEERLIIPITNASGGTLAIGKVVYPSGATGAEYASSHTTDESKLIAVVGNSIADTEDGYLVKSGLVIGTVSDPFDTTSFTAGDFVYLSDVLPSTGNLTNVQPDDGSYSCLIGVIGDVDAITGSLFVDITTSELTAEVTDTNGFPTTEKDQLTLSVVEGTRTFTITPDEAQFHFYELGRKYEIAGAESVVWTDEEGEHWFYYVGGVLTHLYEPTLPVRIQIILNYAFVGAVYWDATNSVIVGDIQMEMHGIGMSPTTHLYNHITRGAQFVSGFGIGDLVTGGTGNNDADAQFSVAEGIYFDEDITHNYSGQVAPATIPILYNDGISGYIREGSTSGFAVLGAPAGRLYFNEWTGATWQLTEVTNNDFVLYHIFGFNGQDVNCVSVMGQNEYANATTAREGANQEISNLISLLPFPEMIPIGTIIFQTGNAYTNTVKARVRPSDAGDYVDWRTTELAQGASPSSHANLTNVEEAGAGVSQGHVTDLAQDFAGLKNLVDGATSEATPSEIFANQDSLITVEALNDVDTWTPTIEYSASSTGLTYTSEGSYIKQGRMVTVTIYGVLTTVGTSAGNLQISNLPFDVSDVITTTSVESVGPCYWTTGSSISPVIYVASATSMRFRALAGGAMGNVNTTHLSDGDDFRATITYITD